MPSRRRSALRAIMLDLSVAEEKETDRDRESIYPRPQLNYSMEKDEKTYSVPI